MTDRLRAVIMRRGTSKGVFLSVDDVPPAGADRDALLLEIMGSPDPMQLDGLGGTHSSTSKVVLVGPGTDPDIDVSYWFAQVGVSNAVVDWSGNCGNLTAAVGPYAIDEGIVAADEPETTLRLRNENTGVCVISTVSVEGGHARIDGDFAIAGVPGTGAPVETRYLDPVGGPLGARGALPTRSATDVVDTAEGPTEVSIVNVTHPYVFVYARDLGVRLPSSPDELNRDRALLDRIERVRGECAVLLGAVPHWQMAAETAPVLPRIVLLAESADTGTDLVALGVSMGAVHHALPMTGALCLGAASRIPGTLPSAVCSPSPDHRRISIRHPKGHVVVVADVTASGEVRSVGVVRTARRLMTGTVHLRPRSRGGTGARTGRA